MKNKIQSLFIGLAVLAGVHQTTAQVTNLGIAPAPGGQSVLYWPTSSDKLRVADDHESGHTELGDGEQCGHGQCRDGDELGPGGLFPVAGHDQYDGGHGADPGRFVHNGQLPFL